MWALPTFPKEPGIWMQILVSFGSEGGEEPGKECKTLTTQPLPNTVSESLSFSFLQFRMGVMKKRSRTNGLFAAHTASTLGDALITFPSGGFTKPALDGRTSTTLIFAMHAALS